MIYSELFSEGFDKNFYNKQIKDIDLKLFKKFKSKYYYYKGDGVLDNVKIPIEIIGLYDEDSNNFFIEAGKNYWNNSVENYIKKIGNYKSVSKGFPDNYSVSLAKQYNLEFM